MKNTINLDIETARSYLNSGLTYQEIADIVGCSKDGIKYRLRRLGLTPQ